MTRPTSKVFILDFVTVILLLEKLSQLKYTYSYKAFQLQRSDVQKFCIGLGASYNKTNCRKIVEKPYKSHSISAKVEHLSELQETIMLMIVNGKLNNCHILVFFMY